MKNQTLVEFAVKIGLPQEIYDNLNAKQVDGICNGINESLDKLQFTKAIREQFEKDGRACTLQINVVSD